MRVITYGTFDTLHYGHIALLQRAKALGNYLVVGVSTDEFNALKGKAAHFDYAQRVAFLESLSCIDLIIPEKNWEQKRHDIHDFNIDIFAIGDDWAGKFDYLSEFCQVKYLSRTPTISSTLMRQSISQFDGK